MLNHPLDQNFKLMNENKFNVTSYKNKKRLHYTKGDFGVEFKYGEKFC